MTFSTYIRISNLSHRDVFLWPIEEELRKQWGFIIKSKEFIMLDFSTQKYQLDIDECFFQFKGMKRKIKPKNVYKYKVDVLCQ
jgi:hypothetical protein